MAWLKRAAVAAILSAAAVGCANDSKSARGSASSMPCDRCTYGVSDQKASPPAHYCVINGKKVDCRKNPPECPECAKMTR